MTCTTCKAKPTDANTPIIAPLALSAKAVASMLGISARQVWAMHASGQIGPSPTSLGARLARWDAEEIRDWWRACRAAGRPVTRREWLARNATDGGPANE